MHSPVHLAASLPHGAQVGYDADLSESGIFVRLVTEEKEPTVQHSFSGTPQALQRTFGCLPFFYPSGLCKSCLLESISFHENLVICVALGLCRMSLSFILAQLCQGHKTRFVSVVDTALDTKLCSFVPGGVDCSSVSQASTNYSSSGCCAFMSGPCAFRFPCRG